jgi:uncharacterized lipoprotein YmbA
MLLGACFGNSRATQYYVLSPMVEKTSTEENTDAEKIPKKSLIVLVGPLELAKYLDRTNMVYRSKLNELIVSDFDLWAEGLDNSITRVMARNLSMLLPSNELTISSWQSLAHADIEIPLAIDRFDCEEGRVCHLRIFWSIKHQDRKKASPPTLHEFTKQTDSPSASDQAKALSQLLAEASKIIAGEISFMPFNSSGR